MSETLLITTAPTRDSTVEETPRVVEHTFGDGYVGHMPDGLDPTDRRVTLIWDAIPAAECDSLVAFLVAHIGKPFLMAMPRERTPRAWLVESWDRTFPFPSHHAISVTMLSRHQDTQGGIAYSPVNSLSESPNRSSINTAGPVIVDSLANTWALG